MDPANVLATLGVSLLAAVAVSLWTARVAFAAQGRKVATALLASVEATTFLIVFNLIAANLDAPERLVGYAAGVAAGTLAGLTLNDRFSFGQSSIQITAPGRRPGLGRALRDAGWPATVYEGAGVRGPVTVVVVVVDDSRVAVALADLRRIAPDGFVTVQRLQRIQPVPLPVGLRAAGVRRRRCDRTKRCSTSGNTLR